MIKKKDLYDENFLFNVDERCSSSEIQVTDPWAILESPLMEDAFNRVLNKWEPQHKFAIISLCTATKPFINSPKWRILNEVFGDTADLIVCSSAGIIPLQYCTCWPFNTYADDSGSESDELYKELMIKRLDAFLKKCNYEKVVYLFKYNTRNHDALTKVGWEILIPKKQNKDIERGGALFKPMQISCPTRYPVVNYYYFKRICKEFGMDDSIVDTFVNTRPNIITYIKKLYDSIPFDTGYSFEEMKLKLDELIHKDNIEFANTTKSTALRLRTWNVPKACNEQSLHDKYVKGLKYDFLFDFKSDNLYYKKMKNNT